MDGLETLRQITRRFRVPVIVVSALTTEGASATFKALALGAFDFVAKPRDAASAHMDEIALDLINKIKVAAKSKLRNTTAPVVLDRPRPNKMALRPRREPRLHERLLGRLLRSPGLARALLATPWLSRGGSRRCMSCCIAADKEQTGRERHANQDNVNPRAAAGSLPRCIGSFCAFYSFRGCFKCPCDDQRDWKANDE